MKGDLTKLLEDKRNHKVLVEMTDDGFIHVENEGKYYILVDEQGIFRYYDPTTDTILPYIEREEYYDN